MTDSEINALAESKYPTKMYEIGRGHEGSPYTSQLEQKLAFIAGYKAALSGTERVECYLLCTFSEGENFISTENGALPLKKTTLTVLNPSNQQS